jgi:SAM-dependent methyltransferase
MSNNNQAKKVWNNLYKKKNQFSVWPWSDLVSLCSRYCNFTKKLEVLEIGCGVGANVPFFLSKNCKYTGVDISKNAINFLKKKYRNKNKNLKFICSDYSNIKINKKFDLIIDRGAITCGNDLINIKKIILKVYQDLKNNGKFICVDWFSKKTYGYKILKEKPNFISLKKSLFSKVGKIYFVDEFEIRKLFKRFQIVYLSEKIINNLTERKNSSAFWSFVCIKKKNI